MESPGSSGIKDWREFATIPDRQSLPYRADIAT
jgi:hypothetical protein